MNAPDEPPPNPPVPQYYEQSADLLINNTFKENFNRDTIFEPRPSHPDPEINVDVPPTPPPSSNNLLKQEQQDGIIEPHPNKLLRQLSLSREAVPDNAPVYYADESSFTETESDIESTGSKKKRYIEDTEEEIEIATKRQKLRHPTTADNVLVRLWKNVVAWFQQIFHKKKR